MTPLHVADWGLLHVALILVPLAALAVVAHVRRDR